MSGETSSPLGIELASVLLPAERALFVVMGYDRQGEDPILELGTWRIAGDFIL
jgi:hypothetical protein